MSPTDAQIDRGLVGMSSPLAVLPPLVVVTDSPADDSSRGFFQGLADHESQEGAVGEATPKVL